MKSIRSAFWVAGMVFLAAIMVFFVHMSSNNLEFSQYNSGWNGTSRFFSDLDYHNVKRISDPAQLAGPHRNATLLIISPYRKPTTQEISAYRSFLQQGNMIFIADDFGTANGILQGLGSSIRIMPGNLSSIDREYANLYSVVVYRTANTTSLENVLSIVLNRPAALEGGAPLMRTSALSWIDLNGDMRINNDELLGAFDVMESDPLFRDRLIVLSDPSIFINSMADAGENRENRQLIQNLGESKGPLLIDEMNSRTRNAEGLGEIFHIVRTTFIIKVLIVGVLVLMVALMWRRGSSLR